MAEHNGDVGNDVHGAFRAYVCKLLHDVSVVYCIRLKCHTVALWFAPKQTHDRSSLADSLPTQTVISMGPGREEENGMIAPMPDIAVGDVIIAKNPWGIGPKDEETSDGKKLSFMRAQDIAAVCGPLVE